MALDELSLTNEQQRSDGLASTSASILSEMLVSLDYTPCSLGSRSSITVY